LFLHSKLVNDLDSMDSSCIEDSENTLFQLKVRSEHKNKVK